MRRNLFIAIAMFMVAIGTLTVAYRSTARSAESTAFAEDSQESQPVVVPTAPPVPLWTTTTSTTAPPPTTPPTTAPKPKATKPKASVPAKAAAPVPAHAAGGDIWELVYKCEGVPGGWANLGPSFQGGLGFAASSWAGYGGLAFASNAGRATSAQQKIVAERIMPGGPHWSGRSRGTCDGYHGW